MHHGAVDESSSEQQICGSVCRCQYWVLYMTGRQTRWKIFTGVEIHTVHYCRKMQSTQMNQSQIKAQEQETEMVAALNLEHNKGDPTVWAAFTVMTKSVPAATNWIILPEFDRSHMSSCRY